VAREQPRDDQRAHDRSPDLGALLAALAPRSAAPLAAALDELLDGLIGAPGAASTPRALVAALVAAGAEGAELWVLEAPQRGGWRRLAAAGLAVPDAEDRVSGRERGYPGAVGVVRAGTLALAFGGAHPGSDQRERHEDLAETLLAVALACRVGALDPGREPGGPLGSH
jgi:hypothetical protein